MCESGDIPDIHDQAVLAHRLGYPLQSLLIEVPIGKEVASDNDLNDSQHSSIHQCTRRPTTRVIFTGLTF
jgi:hypothetical protein